MVFTMQVLANGVYTFELHETLDHYDPNSSDEDITLTFGIDVYDSSGDMTETTIRVRVKDDGSVASDDEVTASADAAVTGNVLDNDDLGIEGANVSSIAFGETIHEIAEDGSVTIDGNHGTLTINSDGTYSYTANADSVGGTDVFAYATHDSDGDFSTANLSINVIGASAVITAADGADNFIFQAIQDAAVEIEGFDTAEDTVDLSALIEGADDVSDAINNFVYLTEQDGDTIISVDVDGADGPEQAVEVAKLKDVTGISAEDLIDNGVIVV